MSLQIYDYYFNGARNMGKMFEKQRIFKLLPLQGALLIVSVPRVLPWATSFWAFSPFLNHLQKSERIFIPEVHYRLNSILCQEQRFQLILAVLSEIFYTDRTLPIF